MRILEDKDVLVKFYDGVLQAGMRLVKLKPHTKQTVSKWECSILPNTASVIGALESGFNVGFLLQGKDGIHPNPLGLWGLDVDSKVASDQFDDSPFDVMVSRKHEFKRHLLGRLPDPSKFRFSSNIRGSHDVKLTGILVAPGSIHEDGTVYQVYVRNPKTRDWVTWNGESIAWNQIAQVDPTPYRPIQQFTNLPASEVRSVQIKTGLEWALPSDAESSSQVPDWCCAVGSPAVLEFRARNYVRSRIIHGIVSRAGDGGRKTLIIIATHLRQYLQIPLESALDFLMNPLNPGSKSWNANCVDARTGKPYPWTESELRQALLAAEHYIPYYGIIDLKKQNQLVEVKQRMEDFIHTLEFVPGVYHQNESTSVQLLFDTFMSMYSIPLGHCTKQRFALCLSSAVAIDRLDLTKVVRTRKKTVHYAGISLDLIYQAINTRAMLNQCA